MLPAHSRFVLPVLANLPGLASTTPAQLSRTSRVTQQRVTFCANFSRLSEAGGHVNPKGDLFCTAPQETCGFRPERTLRSRPIRTAQTIKTTERPDKRARSTQLLQNSTAVAWVWTPAMRLRSRPSHRDQTLGLRSANPSAGSSHLRSHPNQAARCSRATQPLPRREASASLSLIRLPHPANRCNFTIPHRRRTIRGQPGLNSCFATSLPGDIIGALTPSCTSLSLIRSVRR